MATREDIESYIVRLGMPYEEVDTGLWIIHDEHDGIDNLVIHFAPPVAVFRVKLMDLDGDHPALYRRLLELNASDMVSGAYGIENNSVVCVESLQVENLDFNEFQAAVDSLSLAITDHYETLRAVLAGAA
ncbi:MAG: hypothetical protein AMXMBFR64_32250 [Myxococcales bacterium]